MYRELCRAYQAGKHLSIVLGGIVINDQVLSSAPVHIIVKTLNRHGLIAGATGSGKTKTMQALVEQLSLAGVPSLVMDIKGDLSGLAMPGDTTDALNQRANSLSLAYTPRAFPVEFLTLTKEQVGIPVRSTVNALGPILFSYMLDLNEVQEAGLTILFEFAKEEKLPLISLADVRALLQFLQTVQGKEKIALHFGTLSSTSLSTIMRKVIALETQGAGEFFGEPSFNIKDLIRKDRQNLGIISIVRLLNMQDRPKLFSAFMLQLLSDLYTKMPELGDLEKPKLMLFFDEAHLIFAQANKALLQLINNIVKLIRSKGVGIIFCTQNPADIPESILSQLGLKIQHALRAFTAKDRKSLRLVAQNFPISTYYQTEQLLTDLSIGDAIVSALDANGKPTLLVQCTIRAPESRMGVLTAQELSHLAQASSLLAHYNLDKVSISAKDILAKQQNNGIYSASQPSKKTKETSILTVITKNTLFRQVIRQVVRSIMQALLGNKKR